MAMFPLRSSCFVDAAVAAHNALELAIDHATSQVGNPNLSAGGLGHWERATTAAEFAQGHWERATTAAEFAQGVRFAYCRARVSRFTPPRVCAERNVERTSLARTLTPSQSDDGCCAATHSAYWLCTKHPAVTRKRASK